MNIIIAQLLLVFACQGVYSRQNRVEDIIWFPIDGVDGGYQSSLGEKYVNQLEGSQYDYVYDTIQNNGRSLNEEDQYQPERQYETFQTGNQYDKFQNQPGSQYDKFQNQPGSQYDKFQNQPGSQYGTYLIEPRHHKNTWNAISPGLPRKENGFVYNGNVWATRTKRSPAPQRRSFTMCMRNCPTTLEYAPLCGTDRRSYSNRGELNCAINCGKRVGILHDGPC